MSPYESFVINQTRRVYPPRTLSEAFRGADYGTAIWRCEKPSGWGMYALVETLIILGVVFTMGLLLAPYLS